MKTKTCAYCHKRKPLTEYYRAYGTRDGLLRRCKACFAVWRRRHYLKNREEILEQQRRYDAAHRLEKQIYRETHKESARAYYLRNREKKIEYARRYREARKALATA